MHIVIGPHKIDVPAQPGSLLQAIYLSGLVEPPSMCSGLAGCGKCRVRFLPESAQIPPPLPDDTRILGPEATAQGWRLACRHEAVSGAVLQLPPQVKLLPPGPKAGATPELPTPAPDTATAPANTAPAPSAAGPATLLAVDFGSTSLHFSVLDAKSGARLAGPELWVNPQMGAGADIISRVAYALQKNGGKKLSALSQASLHRMVAEAQAHTGQEVREITLAANPAMCMLLLGKPANGLAAAPYRLDYRGGGYEDLHGLPPLWVAPLIAPFVGGDLSAGYAALAMQPGHAPEYPFILADMGTNGEFILALDPNTALAASLPLGPALEGIGMSCGAEARPGVITGFALSPTGLEPQILPTPISATGLAVEQGPANAKTAGTGSGQTAPASPVGISGTGYISLVAQLLTLQIIAPSGLFNPAPPAGAPPIAKRLAQNLRQKSGQNIWQIRPDWPLYLAASDVEELLKIKAAFSLALKLLLQKASLPFAGLKALYLAGALGAHVKAQDLQTLGFIPPGSGSIIKSVGNSSLAGAELLARQPQLRGPLQDWTKKVQLLDIVSQPDFQGLYTQEMYFGD